jgi:[acyl-carrier-protein] S-malonyltransferase
VTVPEWSTIALTFPGQGSQQVGMGADLARAYPVAAALFVEADQVLGESFAQICFDGPSEALDDTRNTQPALYVVGVAVYRVLEAHFGPFQPLAAAGHSVGELTALTAAGALNFADGLRLVRERALAMYAAGTVQPGAMAALLGPTVAEAEAICADASIEIGQPVVVANDNCPGQVVISGNVAALDRALQIASERGVKRAIKLAVSIAAHSPLMTQAAERFQIALADTPFQLPRFPVISNATMQPLATPDDIRAALGKQLNSPVHWTDSVRALRTMGATTFLELGPKDVLTGLLKRIDRAAVGVPLNSAEALQIFINR